MNKSSQTECFLHYLCCYLKANPASIVNVKNYDKVSADTVLLGYYDDEYYYIRPNVFIPCFRAVMYPEYDTDMLMILRELFAMDFIKVHWILTGEVRYRPQKRVGKTRKRYITFYRRQLEKYMNEVFMREENDEKK